MKSKKESSSKVGKQEQAGNGEEYGRITSRTDLKNFLLSVRDKMADEQAAPIYAMSAINYVLNLPDIYNLLDNENKELARDVWLRVKQSGMQVRTPALLFEESERTPLPGES